MPDTTVLIRDLAGCAIRATVFASAVGCLLALFRVRDVSTRLAAWTVVLAGSLLMPVFTLVLPPTEIPVPRLAPETSAVAASISTVAVVSQEMARPEHWDATPLPAPQPAKFEARVPDWRVLAISIWTAVALAMLAQISLAIWYGRKLLRSAEPVALDADAPVFESDVVRVPITVGSFCSAIVLPPGWRTWGPQKLQAVLAHESAHVKRRDPLRQLAASVYRAVFWFHPLAWWLHRHVAELAEQASDDAALAATRDETGYAEILLHFFAAAPRRVQWDAVAMATQGKATKRMERILNTGRTLSTGLSRGIVTALIIGAVPLLYVAASATPVWAIVAEQEAPPPPAAPAPTSVPAHAALPSRVAVPAPPAVAPIPVAGVPAGVAAAALAAPPVPPVPVGAAPVLATPAHVPAPVHALAPAQVPQPPHAPQPPPAHWDGGDSFAIIGPNGKVMGAHVDSERVRNLGKDGEVLWFRRGSDEYVVRDPATIQRVKDAFQPLHDYGKQMGEKGRMQGDVARKLAQEIRREMEPNKAEMERVGREMGKVGADMGRAHDNQAEMARLEKQMKALEAEMNAKSKAFDEIGKKFDDENSEFHKWQQQFEREMEAMGKQMEHKAQEAQEKVKSIEDEALKSKKAEKLL